MKFPLISVIIPVYRAERYLPRCIESFLNQTFHNFELLLIDDGSPDRSGEICDEYADKDKRIRVFHKENGGVSSARQLGVEKALGIYSIHADPDDWVEPSMLEHLSNVAIKNNVELVICDFYINKEQAVYTKQKPTGLMPSQVLKDLFNGLHGSCCNKLLKHSCYKEFDIRFPLGLNYCEDFLVWVQLLQQPIQISYVPHAYYHYDVISNANSLTRSYTREAFSQREKFLVYLEKLLGNGMYTKEIRKVKLSVKFEAFCNRVLSADDLSKVYREVNKYALTVRASWVNKILFWITLYTGSECAYTLYSIKERIKRLNLNGN